jgi:hypothetical protein
MVTIQFQSPDWNANRNECGIASDSGVTVTVNGFDLDHDVLTVYPAGEEPDHNYVLAVKAPWMNESGEECGDIGWLIAPDSALRDKVPGLREHVGKRYGRVLVFADDSVLHDIRRIASETDRPSHARLARIQNRLDDAGLPTPIPVESV